MNRAILSLGLLLGVSAAWVPITRGQEPEETPAIADNSFLMEEAYNQEPGVVQHINAFLRLRNASSWFYTFVQEWPVFSQKSQLSFTMPVQRIPGSPSAVTGIGDVALNYRYQLAGVLTKVSVAPRLSLLLPTGDEEKGLGAGALGVQVNLPVSATFTKRVVSHWNAGATVTPSAKNTLGEEASTTSYNLGGSVIWLARPTFNVMLEVVWTRSETVAGPGATANSDGLLISPGIRWAHNFSSGLQIVPGIAFPIGVGPSRGKDAVFIYLSFEHPFLKAAK
ncbi:MAG: transporter [Gemmatimonadales bacterium]